MFKISLMTIVILMTAGANGGKLYLQVKHQQHFGIHELEEQEYIKLGPGSRLERELSEYFEEQTTTTTDKTTTLQEDDYVDSEEDTSNTTTEDISLVESIIYANATDKSPDEEAMLYTNKIEDLYDDESMLSANDTDDLYDQETMEYESTVGSKGQKSWYAPFTERAARIKQYLSKKFRSLVHSKKKKVDIDDKESISSAEFENLNKENRTGIDKKSEMELETLRKWNDVYSRGKRSETRKNDLKLTKKDIKPAKKSKLKLTITLVSVTIGVVLVLILICYCCVKCGKNCPCCFLCCPCLIPLSFMNSVDPSELKTEKMKTVMPGVITHKDGSIEHYKPSPEEMECLLDIMGK